MSFTRRSILLWTGLVFLSAIPFHVPAQSTLAERWFEVESLNEGLGEAPADLGRHTPRQTVSELLRLAEREDYGQAAHLLNLNDLGEDEQKKRGPELARKLVDVISRTMVIDWGALPARPDALLEQSANETPLAGQERRSLGLTLLELERRPGEIRVSRFKPAEGEAVWLFSSQTVRDIDALYERYVPGILASFQIAIAKPVRIGDTVKYQDYWGYVESIYYSFLILRIWDGRRLVVPVQYFITYPFENWSMVDPSITRTFTLRLDHSAAPGKLREVFEEIVTRDKDALDAGMTLTLRNGGSPTGYS